MHYINILIYYLDFTFAQQLLHMKEFNTLFNLVYKLTGTPSQLKHRLGLHYCRFRLYASKRSWRLQATILNNIDRTMD